MPRGSRQHAGAAARDIGRALWFVAGADPSTLAFTGQRASDLERLTTALRPIAPHHAHSYELWRSRIPRAAHRSRRGVTPPAVTSFA